MAEKADGATTAPPPPRRGKFLSGPPPSATTATTTTTSPPPAKSQSRGKFLNSSSAPNKSSSTSTDGGGSTSTTGETSLSTLKQQIHQARLVASTRRRAISSSRDEIFNDLEEAETIVLALLQCASEVSESLSKMTMARSRNQIDDDDGNGSNNNGDSAASFEQLSAQVRLNGVGYLAGVTKLHELLAPHASLVKSYRNHTPDAAAGTAADNTNNNNNNNNNLQGAASSDATSKNSSEIASFNPNSSEIVNMATSNMYAARVEKRLAVERREILKEMIRLEEEGLQQGESGKKEVEGSTLSNNKRKR